MLLQKLSFVRMDSLLMSSVVIRATLSGSCFHSPFFFRDSVWLGLPFCYSIVHVLIKTLEYGLLSSFIGKCTFNDKNTLVAISIHGCYRPILSTLDDDDDDDDDIRYSSTTITLYREPGVYRGLSSSLYTSRHFSVYCLLWDMIKSWIRDVDHHARGPTWS